MTRGEERIWWTWAGKVLYAVDGRDMDCLEPFFKLPTMCEARFEPETEQTNKATLKVRHYKHRIMWTYKVKVFCAEEVGVGAWSGMIRVNLPLDHWVWIWTSLRYWQSNLFYQDYYCCWASGRRTSSQFGHCWGYVTYHWAIPFLVFATRWPVGDHLKFRHRRSLLNHHRETCANRSWHGQTWSFYVVVHVKAVSVKEKARCRFFSIEGQKC